MKPIYANYEKEIKTDKNGYVQMMVQNIYGEIFKVPQREHKDDLIFMDGTAAVGHLPINFKEMGIDLLAFGAHKFNGLRGAGCLIIKKSVTPVSSLIWGGDVTGGTPAPALAYAMAVALKFNCDNMEEHLKKIITMRDFLINELSQIQWSQLNGPTIESGLRAPNNVNMGFGSFISGKEIMEGCADYALYISTGSACAADDYIAKQGGICVRQSIADKLNQQRKPEIITIFEAGGLNANEAGQAIRITLGWENTVEECQKAIKIIKEVIDFKNPFD